MFLKTFKHKYHHFDIKYNVMSLNLMKYKAQIAYNSTQ